ncbi:MAG: patatin-like phospholipase family protein [Actinomycetota bacterium]|nr:patatin-like phospholipase family protein [Actinomycetota bacterium]
MVRLQGPKSSASSSPDTARRRVVVVLGAGGPVGHAFHAGVLAALGEEGWDGRSADLLVGTSVGAITAALLRAGLSPADLFAYATDRPLSEEGAALLEKGWPDTGFHIDLAQRRRRGPSSAPGLLAELVRSPHHVRVGLIMAALAPTGEVATDVIIDGFGRLLGPLWPQAPLLVPAVDLDVGTRMVFGAPGAPRTEPGRAVAASCAVPSYFIPVDIAGRRYVDGGLFSPSNTDLVGAHGGHYDAVVTSVPMGIGGWPHRRGLDLPGRLTNQRAAQRGLRSQRRSGVAMATFAPGPAELQVMHYDAFELDHLSQIAHRAAAATRLRLRRDPTLRPLTEILRDHAATSSTAETGFGAGIPT